MRVVQPWAAAVLLVAGLAGCLGGAGQPAEGASTTGVGTGAGGLGAVAGVVVSEAIVPLAGASVGLEPGGLAATTDAEGVFRFSGLEPGSYTLAVSLAGFVAQTVAVAAGQGLVQVILATDTSATAYVEAYVHDGFMDYSANVAGARTSNNNAPNYTFDGRVPDAIQVEIVWESTQAFGSRMDLTLIANDGGTLLPVAGRADGPSPLMVHLDQATIQEFGFGPDVLLDVAVFVGGEELAPGAGAGLALQQPFRLFTHMFYGYAPPDGWRFSTEGTVPLPPTE